MYLRKRNSNLSIERAVYKAAVKDEQGIIIQPTVRTTKYLGSISTLSRFCTVPPEILEQLTEEEKRELRVALLRNEPEPFSKLREVAMHIFAARKDIQECAQKHGNDRAKKLLETDLRSAIEAWESFFKTAQDYGLRRKPKRRKPGSVAPSGA